MKKVEDFLIKIFKYADIIARYVLLIMVGILVANMIARPIWHSFIWVYDLTGLLAVASISLCLPYCYVQGGLVTIDLVTKKFPKVVQLILRVVCDLVSLALVLFVSWCEYKYLLRMIEQHITSSTVHIIHWPFAICMLIGFALFFIALLLDVIKRFTGGEDAEAIETIDAQAEEG